MLYNYMREDGDERRPTSVEIKIGSVAARVFLDM